MNILNSIWRKRSEGGSAAFHPPSSILHPLWSWLCCAVLIFAIEAARAADTPRPGRFLLVFETSPVLKKNLPALRQTLGKLFEGNLQKELHSGDDVAVWTLDRNWHAGQFQTERWAPQNAAMYMEQLGNFVEQQDFTRHASLDAIQPVLDRVVKSSERLTVLIFCDTKSRLPGTPFDSDINETINNVAKVGTIPLILVLRSYHGEYIGGTVNQFGPLNFPKFPPPPKPAPPPVASSPATVPAPRPHAVQLPPLIVIGTNTHTSASVNPATVSASAPVPPPATAPATNATVPMTPAPVPPPAPVSTTVAVQPSNSVPAPAPVQSAPSAPVPAPGETPSSAQAVAPPAAAPANPPVAQSPNSVAGADKVSATESPAVDAGSRWSWFAGGAGGVLVAALVIWLVARSRRPHSSLITSSMQNDRLPPK